MNLKSLKEIYSVLIILVLLSSCSPYQDALKSANAGVKFKMADSLYNEGRYRKALRLMEQIVPVFRGKPQGEKLMYMYSNAYYQLEDNNLSAYQFNRFSKSYPNSDKLEEAIFKSAKSYYKLSPRHSLDQVDTDKALEELQVFINRFPNSVYLDESNALVLELRSKLERKRFEIAKQYGHTEDFKAGIAAFEIFITQFPGSPFRAEATFLRFKYAYTLGMNSFEVLVKERLDTALEYYTVFDRYYADSSFKAEADEMKAEIEERLELNKKLMNPSKNI